MNRQGVPTDRQPSVNTDRRKRFGWWLAAGLPVVAALLIILLDGLHPPDLNERYDVSSRCLLWLGGLLIAVGLAMAIMAIDRGRRAWNEAQKRSARSSRQAQLAQAYEIRLRSAWIIIVGTVLTVLGGSLIWLAIGAL